jgi:hypothetical protein
MFFSISDFLFDTHLALTRTYTIFEQIYQIKSKAHDSIALIFVIIVLFIIILLLNVDFIVLIVHYCPLGPFIAVNLSIYLTDDVYLIFE